MRVSGPYFLSAGRLKLTAHSDAGPSRVRDFSCSIPKYPMTLQARDAGELATRPPLSKKDSIPLNSSPVDGFMAAQHPPKHVRKKKFAKIFAFSALRQLTQFPQLGEQECSGGNYSATLVQIRNHTRSKMIFEILRS